MSEPNLIQLTPIEMSTPAYGGAMFLYDGPYTNVEIISIHQIATEGHLAGYYQLVVLDDFGNREYVNVPGDQKLTVEDRPFEGL